MARLAQRLRSWVRQRRGHLAAGALFAAVLLVMFAPVVSGAKVFTNTATQQGYVYPWASEGAQYPFWLTSDQSDLSMPALAVQQRAYEAGELPHVDLYSYGGGYPLYADLSTGQAYPPRMVLAALFTPVDAHFLFTVMHLWAAGWFTYLLLRRLGTRWLPAVAAGMAWMLGGWTLAWMHLAPVVVQSAAIPACLWAVHRAEQRRTWEAVSWAGVLLGASVVAGHALIGALTAAIAGVYLVALVVQRARIDRPASWRAWWRMLSPVPLTALVAVGVWAVALLPFAAASAESARAPLTWEQMSDSQLASPRVLTHLLWPPSAPVNLDEMNSLPFVGLLMALAALVGLVSRRPGAALGRWVLIGSAVAMLPGPGSWLTYHLVPLMDVFRPYSRLALYMGFGVVLLGGVGIDVAGDRVAARLHAGRGWMPQIRRSWYIAAGVLVALNSVHLAWFGLANNPELAPRSSASVLPDTPFVVALREAAAGADATWPGRVAAMNATELPGGPPTVPMLWAAHGAWIGVEVSSGYNSSLPPRSQRLLRVLAGEPVESVLAGDTSAAFTPVLHWGIARVDLLATLGYDLVAAPPLLNSASEWGARHVASGDFTVVWESEEGTIYRVTGATAGARGVEEVAVVNSDREALERLAAGEVGTSTVLLSADDLARLGLGLTAGDSVQPAVVSEVSRGPNGYRFTVRAVAPTLVLVPVNWSEGWEATADGGSLPLVRGNYQQMVVAVPEGVTEVSLQYTSPGFEVGLWVSSLTVLLLVAVPGARWVRRRQPAAPDQTGENTETPA